MNKEERVAAINSGKIILRPQFDPRKSCWRIAKSTRSFGWARFGKNWYTTSQDAMNTIDMIISKFPDQYLKEI